MSFTHIEKGKVRMVDVSGKDESVRIASAEGFIRLKKETVDAILQNRVAKGNVIATANVAGVMAVKKTSELIPMCHPLPVTSVNFDFEVVDGEFCGVKVRCSVKTVAKTGVEMEALTGVSVALLTIWDMVKSMEKDEKGEYPETVIEGVRVVEKVVAGKQEGVG